MYKKVSGKLQRWRVEGGPKFSVPEKGNTRDQNYPVKVGIVARLTGGNQEIRLIGLYAHEGSLFLGGIGLAQGAKPGDRVRLYYNRRFGLWFGTKIYQSGAGRDKSRIPSTPRSTIQSHKQSATSHKVLKAGLEKPTDPGATNHKINKISIRQQAIETLVASGPSGILSNLPGILTVTRKVGDAVSLVLKEAGVVFIEAINPNHDCGCRRKLNHSANMQLHLCQPHRALVDQLFESAGYCVPVRLPSRKRKRPPPSQKRKKGKRKRTVDLYKAGLIVSGGLPGLGKRR